MSATERIHATCPINKIERSISRLFRGKAGRVPRTSHAHYDGRRLHRYGPQTAGIRALRMNGGDATGGVESQIKMYQSRSSQVSFLESRLCSAERKEVLKNGHHLYILFTRRNVYT